MQVNFNTTCNNSYHQSFESAEITEKALNHLKTRYLTPKDMDRFEKIVKHFEAKGDFIRGTLDEVNGNLTASINSPSRHSESSTEGWFSHLFRSPIHFLETWAKRADVVEKMCNAKVKLEELAKSSDVISDSALIHLKTRQLEQKDVDRLEKLLKQLEDHKKERLVKVSFYENLGDLRALLHSDRRYSKNITEGWFSHLFCSPIEFMEKCVQKANKVEKQLESDIKLENITNN